MLARGIIPAGGNPVNPGYGGIIPGIIPGIIGIPICAMFGMFGIPNGNIGIIPGIARGGFC